MAAGVNAWEQGGDFHIGLRPIPVSAWLEGGEAAPWLRKDPLFERCAASVWGEAPGSREGQLEAAALVDAAIGVREPRTDLPPLYAAARCIADDLCLMERVGGDWRLTAASLSAPTFFTAAESVGRSLAELHAPVPGFHTRFLERVSRLFDALRPGLVLERRNWTLVNSPDLFVPEAAPMRASIGRIDPACAGQELRLRVERQTLRRLPSTGGAVFSIRVRLTPLAELAGDQARLERFALAWRGASPDFRDYKRLQPYDRLVETFLRAAGETYSVNGS